MLQFALPNDLGILVVTDSVLRHFEKNRQIGPFSRERGGQLFCRFEGTSVIIEQATGPRAHDQRGRYYFIPNRRAEQIEINRLYASGLHYVGDWHTHAEGTPEPSENDIRSMSNIFSKSHHELAGIVMAIIGRAPFPAGLHMSLYTAIGVFPVENVDGVT